MLYPVPAVLVSVADSAGNDNLITIAWTGTVCSDPAMTYISVRNLDTHSQNRTFRASLLRNFVLFMNGRPLRPADLTNFYASMKFVQI